jgi:glutamine cyclotransferase
MTVLHTTFERLIATLAFLTLIRPFAFRAISKESEEQGASLLQTGRTRESEEQVPAELPSFHLELIRTVPHENMPFTQGLEISTDGQHLVETSGAYPPGTPSYVRLVDPATGATVSTLQDGLDGRFIEGITQRPNGNWVASTYQDKKAVEYDPDLKMIAEYKYPHTGWGLTRSPDGESFLATNGSDVVMTLDKNDFSLKDAKAVTCLGKRVTGMNELELVDDFAGLGPTLLGNLYLSRLVLAVKPTTGECIGTFSLNGLGQATPGEAQGFHAANGLAWNKTSQTLWATGKNWDQMYEVRVTTDPQQFALQELSNHLYYAAPTSPMLMELSSAGDSRMKAAQQPRAVNILRYPPPPN